MNQALGVQTLRLLLRPLAERDAPFILNLLNQRSFVQFIGDRNVRTLEAARAYIAAAERNYELHGFGLLLVESKTDASSMGLCGLVRRDYLQDPDLGFAFLPEYWAQGFALEASRAILEQALATRPRILAIVQPDNSASIRLLQKLGMHATGIVHPAANEPDLLLYARER